MRRCPCGLIDRKFFTASRRHAVAWAASDLATVLDLSAWLNEALLNALAIEDGLSAVAEWEAEHGADR